MQPLKHNHAWGAKPSERCPVCDLDRTGPYRLADGTWSDGVDRTKRIADQHSGDECVSRMYVWQFHSAYYDKIMWAVARSEPYTDQDFHKFAEAIAYADRMARTNQGENNEGLQ